MQTAQMVGQAEHMEVARSQRRPTRWAGTCGDLAAGDQADGFGVVQVGRGKDDVCSSAVASAQRGMKEAGAEGRR